MAARTVRIALVGLMTAATAVVTLAPAASADSRETAGEGHRQTQAAMDALVASGLPGVVGQARDERGTWKGDAGVGNLETGAPRGPNDAFRVGSITKTFVATVILQLEAEGRLDLDDTVEKWLPGVVRGNGHDGHAITLRQVLNHTSGIYNVTADPGFQQKVFSKDFLQHRYDTWTDRQLVDVAMGHAPDFAPGTDWNYSNTNYVIAGMVVEKATGNGYADEIRRRVIRPLGLHGTRSPGTEATMPRPAGRAYSSLGEPDIKEPFDVTELNPSLAGAAGDMISTAGDLDRFYTALLRGKLLPRQQLKEMTTTVAIGAEAPGDRYGLGIQSLELSCGVTVWGHGGGIHGSSSMVAATRDARHTLAYNVNGDWAASGSPVEAEFCPK